MKKYKLTEVEDNLIGLPGTLERNVYENDLRLHIIGDMIRAARKARKLTQEELGTRIGVKKAQISRLENKTGNFTVETLINVFDALDARVNLRVELL
jgi:DNA-binding XRE family transcriptional regulator